MNNTHEPESKDRYFQSTLWSMVLEAGHPASPDSRAALEKLCSVYWYPLYVYARRRVVHVHQAQDLTQSFFASVIEKNVFSSADPHRGKFRAFLLTAFKNFLANEWNKDNAQKRGGDRQVFQIDFLDGERQFQREPAISNSPEDEFDKQWALALLGRVFRKLETEYMSSKKNQFEYLSPFITNDNPVATYAQVASQLEISESAVKVGVHRLRRRYRELLHREIAQTLAHSDVEEEIGFLFSIFQR